MNELFEKNTITVTGTIFDQDMKAIAGANITEVGTNKSTSTDKDGQFTIEVASSSSQLRITHVGYDYDTVSVSDFNKLGYWQIYYAPETLPDANVTAGPGASKSSNMLLPIIALVLIGALIASHSSKPKQVTP